MEFLADFSLHSPATVEDAVAAFAANAGARYLAGGTDMLVNARRGIENPGALVALGGIDELAALDMLDDGGLRIGAGVTLARLASHAGLADSHPAITQAAHAVAGPTHQEVATVGGNLCLDTRCVYYNQSEWWRAANAYCLKHQGEICHVAPSGKTCFAAFSGDLAPALLVFGAEVEIAGAGGRRTAPLAGIYADDGMAHLLLAPGEMLVSLRIAPAGGRRSGYKKARVRGALDFPLAGTAVALRRDGGTLADIRIALTGTNAKPLLLDGTAALTGQTFDDALLDKLVGLISKQIQPMTSTFTPPGYRRKVAANLTRRLISGLFSEG